MQECLIALGGNLQISGLVFSDALAQLQLRGCSDVEMSSVFKTRPVGAEAGNAFLNAAAVLQTDQSPEELLRTLHEIEAMFCRVRTRHWGPRTLDLDLILYGEFTSNIPQLVVPHPAMWYRRFVLEPAVEVAADMVHPIRNESVAGLHRRLMDYPLRLEICSTGSTMASRFPDEILKQVRDIVNDDINFHPTDSASVIAPDSFARIIVRQGKMLTTSQPMNQKIREIEVVGETAAEVVSQIEHLRIAMLG